MAFLLCAGCSRHVRSNEHACPFCGVATTEAAPAFAPRQASASAIGWGGRAALLLGGVATTAACYTALPAYGQPVPQDDPSRNPPTLDAAMDAETGARADGGADAAEADGSANAGDAQTSSDAAVDDATAN